MKEEIVFAFRLTGVALAAAIRDRSLQGWQRLQVARFPKRAAESALNDNVLHGR